MTLVYNGGKEAKTICGFSVDKAVLKATYSGDDLYYHETLAKGSVKVNRICNAERCCGNTGDGSRLCGSNG